MTPEEAKSLQWVGHPIDFLIPEGVEGPVYCIGDSHVGFIQSACPSIFKPSHWSFEESETVFHSKTAYAVGSDKDGDYIEKSIRSIPRGSKVLVSFGEIDCRHYIPRFAKERGVSLDSLVDESIERFKMQCLNAFHEKYRLIVLGCYVTPHDHYNECKTERETWHNSFEDIVEAKTLLNEKLERYCQETGTCFVPLFRVSQEEAWHEHPIGIYFGDQSHASGCMVPVILNAMVGFKWRNFDV